MRNYQIAQTGRRLTATQVLVAVALVLSATNAITAVQSILPLSGVGTRINYSTIYQLAQWDVVEVLVYQTSGGALNINSAGSWTPEFMMVRLP